MNIKQQHRVLHGAFADYLPPKRKTLKELAAEAVTASVAFCNLSNDVEDDEYKLADDQMLTTRDAFRAALFELTGLTPEMVDQLVGEGVL